MKADYNYLSRSEPKFSFDFKFKFRVGSELHLIQKANISLRRPHRLASKINHNS